MTALLCAFVLCNYSRKKGDLGEDGVDGITGATGPKDADGASGATGPQGPAGVASNDNFIQYSYSLATFTNNKDYFLTNMT